MTRLLILSSNTGEGHNSAASAIREAATSSGFDARVRKPLEESSRINRWLADLYNSMLTHRPQWMSSYFRFINAVRPNERDFFYTKVRRYIGRFIHAQSPSSVLSVHPMLNHFIPRFIREEGLAIPCFAFVTDPFPPFWRGWVSPYIDAYFAATVEAKQALVACGIPESRVECVSMPVRPEFVPATMSEIRELRNALGLDDACIILINGGARGGGPLFEVYSSIRKSAVGANVLVVCGRNPRLRQQIEDLGDPRTRTFGFLADIHRYVAAADIVVTKPGALSVYEALACGSPVVLTGLDCLMPQESGLFNAAKHYDFGFSAGNFAELESIMRQGPTEWNRKRELISRFYVRGHARELIERILPLHVRS